MSYYKTLYFPIYLRFAIRTRFFSPPTDSIFVVMSQPPPGSPQVAPKSVADLKTLSPCGPYSNDRTGNPNAVANARQKKINRDHHSRAKSLNAREDDTRDGFEA